MPVAATADARQPAISSMCAPAAIGAVCSSDAAPLGWPAAIVRYRRHVSDRSDGEPHRLQRTQRRLPSRARPLDFDIERSHAMLHGLAPGIFGGNLRRIWGRFARTFEALTA